MKNKKVAIIGNMNNNGFSLLRYLRDHGVETDLLLYSNDGKGSLSHFVPENDTWSIKKFKKYIHQTNIPNDVIVALDGLFGFITASLICLKSLLRNRKKSFIWLSKNELKRNLGCYDFYIGSGIAPAVFDRLGKTLDIFFPYATGVEFLEAQEFTCRLPQMNWFLRCVHQKAKNNQANGLRKTKNILNGELSFTASILNQYGLKFIPLTIPLFYVETLPSSEEASSRILSIAKRKIASRPYIFQCSRQYWINKKKIPSHKWFRESKNSDWVINAFARYIDIFPARNEMLVLTEYGPDIDESKALVQNLDINERVIWLEKMGRREIIEIARSSELILGEFILDNEAIWGGTGWEALALGKPLIHSFKFAEGRFEELYGYPEPPILKANSEDEILDAISRLLSDPNLSRDIGTIGRRWFHEHNGSGLTQKWMQFLT